MSKTPSKRAVPKVSKDAASASVPQLLKGRGLSNTPARRALIETFRHSKRPLNIQELAKKLGAKAGARQSPDLTTLYRNMESLEKAGILSRVDMHGKADHFELIREHHHHHVFCRECQAVTCVPVCIPDALVTQVSRFGFTQIEHQLQFTALCKNCSRSS